jgi:drug/metabolite transporter (DMT)-like permease
MAQTKRKRRTKHRGTAAGTIESRGRTGRPPTADERKRQNRGDARERRLNSPPTWKSSLMRALLAGALVFVFLLVTAKGKNKVPVAVAFTAVAVLVYIPAGYYLEMFLFRRRMRKKAQASPGGKAGR